MENLNAHQTRSVRSLRSDDFGVTSVEYLIIVMLVTAAVLMVFNAMDGSVETGVHTAATTVWALPR